MLNWIGVVNKRLGTQKKIRDIKKKNEEVKQIGNVENGDLWRTKTLNRLEMLKKGDLIKDTDVKQIREKRIETIYMRR